MESSGLVGFCLTSTCLCQTLSLAVVSGTDEKHSIALFVLPDVSKSSTPHVFVSKEKSSKLVHMLCGFMLRSQAPHCGQNRKRQLFVFVVVLDVSADFTQVT